MNLVAILLPDFIHRLLSTIAVSLIELDEPK